MFPPSNELIGAIAQIQKTLHQVAKRATQDFARITQADGTPTGEEIAVVRPRGVVVAGALTQFSTERGVNYERFASFELFRQQIAGIDIITFDELYARAEAIVGPDLGLLAESGGTAARVWGQRVHGRAHGDP